LAYADDKVLVAKEVNKLKEMLKTFSKFLKKRELFLSVEKSKIIILKKEGVGAKENNGCGIKIEEVDHFKYLGYTMQRNNGTERHIKETVKEVMCAMKQVWRIGQRKFVGDFKRRIWMFDHLVKSILMYGTEIWGWKECETVEKCQDKCIRWTLGLDWTTPSYIVREET